MVKHSSKYSCESAVYFDLGQDIIKENCRFAYYFNKTDITPTVLDRGNEIILANLTDDKHIIYNVNNHSLSSINASILKHIVHLWNRSRK